MASSFSQFVTWLQIFISRETTRSGSLTLNFIELEPQSIDDSSEPPASHLLWQSYTIARPQCSTHAHINTYSQTHKHIHLHTQIQGLKQQCPHLLSGHLVLIAHGNRHRCWHAPEDSNWSGAGLSLPSPKKWRVQMASHSGSRCRPPVSCWGGSVIRAGLLWVNNLLPWSECDRSSPCRHIDISSLVPSAPLHLQEAWEGSGGKSFRKGFCASNIINLIGYTEQPMHQPNRSVLPYPVRMYI